MPAATLSDDDYRRLADLRHGLREFLHWSSEQAQDAGLTPTQHQLLLAIRASTDERGPTVGQVADVLVVRHHSAVGLVDRAEQAGLLVRSRDPDQHSIVRLTLTELGVSRLALLSELHLRELAHLAPTMRALWDSLGESQRPLTPSAAR
jgi:DNA-binding MarR family transcriptional regulator